MQLIEVENFVDSAPLPVGCAGESSLGGGPSAQPDARWIVTDGATFGSRCAVWWRRSPQLQGHRVGLIGSFAAAEERAAKMLLRHACAQLRAEGCTLAVGPMDGNTWGNYRFVTEFGHRPRFWMEPTNPPQWPRHFSDFGFRPLARYFSALNTQLDARDARLNRVARRLDTLGVRVRPICADSFEADLRRIYEVARVAFRNNLLYSDLEPDDYFQQSRQLRELVPLELSWLAEHEEQAVGFLFAVPDLYEQAREERLRTVVIKTLAVRPNRDYAGLGQLLLASVQQQARERGFSRAIHALVRDVRPLRKISARYAQPMRRYTLFAKVLTS